MAGGGNNLNRAVAGQHLGQAVSNFKYVVNAGKDVGNALATISKGYPVKTRASGMGGAFVRAFDNLNQNMQSFCTTIPALNQTLLNLINQGAEQFTGDYYTLDTSGPSWSNIDEVTESESAGMLSFEGTVNDINAYKQKVDAFTQQCNEMISGYKLLHNDALSTGYTNLYDQAHQAAEQVRAIVESMNKGYQTFANNFVQNVQGTQAKNDASALDVSEGIDAIKSAFGSVDYSVISMFDDPV